MIGAVAIKQIIKHKRSHVKVESTDPPATKVEEEPIGEEKVKEEPTPRHCRTKGDF